MAYETDEHGNRYTTFLATKERYWLNDPKQIHPKCLEGAGLAFNVVGKEDRQVCVKGLDIKDLTEDDHSDCLYVKGASHVEISNCHLSGQHDEAIDLIDCEHAEIMDCTLGPPHDERYGKGILSTGTPRVNITRCELHGGQRLPLVYTGVATLKDCFVYYQNYCCEIRGPGARLNIFNTYFERVQGSRRPITLWSTEPDPRWDEHGPWDAPCIYVAPRYKGEPKPVEMVWMMDGSNGGAGQQGTEDLFSNVPF